MVNMRPLQLHSQPWLATTPDKSGKRHLPLGVTRSQHAVIVRGLVQFGTFVPTSWVKGPWIIAASAMESADSATVDDTAMAAGQGP